MNNLFGREDASIFNQKEEVNFLESLYKCIEENSEKDIKDPEKELEPLNSCFD